LDRAVNGAEFLVVFTSEQKKLKNFHK